MDEAFLRRIPYKIEVDDPTVEQFRKLFEQTCQGAGDRLRRGRAGPPDRRGTTRPAARPMRFCHARDLLHQVAIYCKFHERPAEMSIAAIDAAAEDYFSML